VKVLDVCSGIGGFSLGLHAAGMETAAFCEIEDYPRKVLAHRFPGKDIYNDIRDITADRLVRDGNEFDIICGGIPCQPHSFSGDRKASEDSRDLWGAYFNIVSENRPKWAIVENVRGFLSSENGRYFGRVLRDLASIGYDAEWFDLPAGAVGAPHLRPRMWLVAYPNETQFKGRGISERVQQEYANASHSCWGKDKPGVERASNGIPSQMDRLGCLGNAVVPGVVEIIGRAIMGVENGE